MIVTEPVYLPGAKPDGFTVIVSKLFPIPLGVTNNQLPPVVDTTVCQGALFGTVMGMVCCNGLWSCSSSAKSTSSNSTLISGSLGVAVVAGVTVMVGLAVIVGVVVGMVGVRVTVAVGGLVAVAATVCVGVRVGVSVGVGVNVGVEVALMPRPTFTTLLHWLELPIRDGCAGSFSVLTANTSMFDPGNAPVTVKLPIASADTGVLHAGGQPVIMPDARYSGND